MLHWDPATFYIDSFVALLTSIVHKDISVASAGFASRSRYWCCASAEAGSGKSPALDPLRTCLLEVMQQHRDLSPGMVDEEFHLQRAGTHCAAVDRLQVTDGC